MESNNLQTLEINTKLNMFKYFSDDTILFNSDLALYMYSTV